MHHMPKDKSSASPDALDTGALGAGDQGAQSDSKASVNEDGGKGLRKPHPKSDDKSSRVPEHLTLEHMLDHTPMLDSCPWCQMAKAARKAAKKAAKKAVEAENAAAAAKEAAAQQKAKEDKEARARERDASTLKVSAPTPCPHVPTCT